MPTAGRCVISANYLAGYPYPITYGEGRMIGVKRGAWSWFDRLEPSARIGRSLLVFDVSEEDVRRLASGPLPSAGPPR